MDSVKVYRRKNTHFLPPKFRRKNCLKTAKKSTIKKITKGENHKLFITTKYYLPYQNLTESFPSTPLPTKYPKNT